MDGGYPPGELLAVRDRGGEEDKADFVGEEDDAFLEGKKGGREKGREGGREGGLGQHSEGGREGEAIWQTEPTSHTTPRSLSRI